MMWILGVLSTIVFIGCVSGWYWSKVNDSVQSLVLVLACYAAGYAQALIICYHFMVAK